MATYYSPSIVTNGLVLCLDAGNSKSYSGSGTTWYDLSRNGNNGTITTTFYNSNNSGNLAFSGDLYPGTIPYTTALDPTGGLTIEAWIFPVNITTNQYYEIYRKEASPGRQLFSFQEYGTILSFGTDTTGNGYSEQDVSITAANYTNQWVHVVASYTSGVKTVYRNGIPINKITNITGTLQQGNATFFIGSSSGGENFKGNFSSLKVYNRGLSDLEVLQNYNATKSRYTLRSSNVITDSLVLNLDASDLLSYYGASSTWTDLATNNNVTFYNAGGSTYTSNPPGPPVYSASNRGIFTFDGSNDWGKISSQITVTSDVTVSVWLKTTSGGGLLSHCSGGPVNLAYQIAGGKMYYEYYNSSWQAVQGSTSVNNGTWKNCVWAKSGTSMLMYINGVLDATLTLTGSITGPLNCIGSKWGPCNSDSYGAGTDSYGSVFSGDIASVLIYTKTLNATEILQNFNTTKSYFGL